MHRTLTFSSFLLMLIPAFGQQDIYVESFEGSSFDFVINSTDVNSQSVGANTWLVNDVYAGGSGSVTCLGFPLDYTIPATVGQPAGITTPNGNYLHTASSEAVADGILCCSFGAADGFCTDEGNHFAGMATDVSTLGQGDISLSFWWLCQGGTGNYGEVYYSVDGGTEWILITSPIAQYRSQPTWTQQTITLPAFAEQATLRFGYRFVNGTTLFGAADPGFGIDDIRILGNGTVPAQITTGETLLSAYCVESSFAVPYNVEGAFNAGNIFTVELSDAAGSFASPVAIGTIAQTVSGTVPCDLPAGIPSGTAYRVRVISSMPVTVGTVSTEDLSITQPSNAGVDAEVTYCTGSLTVALTTLLEGDPDACGAWIDPFGNSMNGIFDPTSSPAGVYTYTTDCSQPCPADMATLTMIEGNGPGAGNDVVAEICEVGPPFTPYGLIDGGATNGQFWYQDQPFPLPDFGTPGAYEMNYIVQGEQGCPNDTAFFEITVVQSPNAGSGLSYTLCFNASPLDLLTLLSGAEQDGTWTDPSGEVFGGILDPADHISGIYTYTVEGEGPCDDAHAFVAVLIDPCSGIGEYDAGSAPIQWLGEVSGVHLLQLPSDARVQGIGLYDIHGRSIAVPTFLQQGEQVTFDLQERAQGIYFAVVHMNGVDVPVRLLHGIL